MSDTPDQCGSNGLTTSVEQSGQSQSVFLTAQGEQVSATRRTERTYESKRLKRIELSSKAWEAFVLPLHHSREFTS
jgi:hypothetical protein